jgi:hypothetical protein
VFVLSESVMFLLFGLCAPLIAQTAPNIVWQATNTHGYMSSPVAVSPDGSVAATLGSNYMVQIWRMSDGTSVRTLPGYGLWVGTLTFSPDGVYLASGGGDRTAKVWRTADWSAAYSIATANQGPPVAFSPDSATLAVGNGANIELRRATNGSLIHSWPATTGALTALAFSPDGGKIASGAGMRGIDTTMQFWEVPSGAWVRTIPTAQTYSIGRIVFSPDGSQVLTGSEFLYSGPMEAWRVADGALLRTLPEPAYAMAFSVDGTVLAAAGTNITFRRTSDWALIEEYVDGFATYTQGPKGIEISSTNGLFVRSRGPGEIMVGRVPVLVSGSCMENGQMIISWVGGSGKFQLQRSLGLGDDWQDEGDVLTGYSTVIAPEASNAFYRVLSLP